MPAQRILPKSMQGAKSLSYALLAALVGTLLAWPFTAHAAPLLEGETVSTTDFRAVQSDITTVIGPELRVVGPGAELTNFAGFLDINFSDTNILITATMNQPSAFLEVLRFEDANGTIPPFTNVALNAATNFTGLLDSAISFTSDRIDLNLSGLGGLQGQVISLDLVGGANGGNGSNGGKVSEPAAHVLLGLGALVLGLASRRGRKPVHGLRAP